MGVNKYWEYGKKATGASIKNLESQMGGGGGRKWKPDEAQRDELRDLSQQDYCFDSRLAIGAHFNISQSKVSKILTTEPNTPNVGWRRLVYEGW